MNYLALLKVIGPFWWAVPILVVFGILRSAWFKGEIGELFVRVVSYLRLPAHTYRSLHDIILETPDGTTQIDHVIVSRFGIFVIETKHMKGWIFGNERDPQWTQSIFGQSYRFQNPLRQNFKHVKALEDALGIPVKTIHSIVVFSGGCVFKTDLPSNVVRGGRFISLIKSFDYQVFSDGEVSTLIDRLQTRRLPQTFAMRQQHVEHLRTRRDPTAERNCPRCGNRMVIRTARNGPNVGGQFWGCASFPKCKAVQSVT